MLIIERTRGKESVYRSLPVPLRITITYLVVLMSWVFFRANDLSHALGYFAGMFGLNTAQPGAALLGGIIYKPYYVLCMACAAIITWGCPQAWQFTRVLTRAKLLLVCMLFWLSLVVLTTQEFNPFIYFTF